MGGDDDRLLFCSCGVGTPGRNGISTYACRSTVEAGDRDRCQGEKLRRCEVRR